MFDLYYLIPLYTLGVAWLAIRRGQWMPWLLIILFTGPIGATLYLIVELGGLAPRSLGESHRRRRGALARLRANAARLDTVGAWSDLANELFERGRHREAAEAADRVLVKQPDETEARYLLGRARLALGDAPGAATALAAVVEAEPDLANGDARFALARALRASGDESAARGHLERLAETSSRADFLFELATVQEKSGDRSAARATLQRIVDEFAFVPAFMRARVRPWVWRASWRLARMGR